jgi:hypothetical protein
MFKRVNGKLMFTTTKAEEVRPTVMKVDGSIMAVLRPTTPEAAEQAVAKALSAEDEAAFQDIIVAQEKMLFVGLASADGRVLDPQTLEVVGTLQPGDSFVSYEHIRALPPEAVEASS